MLDQKKLSKEVRAPSADKKKPEDLKSLPLAELLRRRDEINDALPARKLTDLDLETEIILQFKRTQELQTSVLGDLDVPANQKAQVANSCASILEQLLKMQTRLYTAERMKTIEQTVLRAIRTLPKETQEQFLADYERLFDEAE